MNSPLLEISEQKLPHLLQDAVERLKGFSRELDGSPVTHLLLLGLFMTSTHTESQDISNLRAHVILPQPPLLDREGIVTFSRNGSAEAKRSHPILAGSSEPGVLISSEVHTLPTSGTQASL